MEVRQLSEEPEIPGLGPDYCYVCQKLIKRSQKKVAVGGEYYRHDGCAPGSTKWMRSEVAKHPKHQSWTRLFQLSKKGKVEASDEEEKEEPNNLTWEEIHNMSREELACILEEEEVPEEDYVHMTTKEIMETLCIMFNLAPTPKKRKSDL